MNKFVFKYPHGREDSHFRWYMVYPKDRIERGCKNFCADTSDKVVTFYQSGRRIPIEVGKEYEINSIKVYLKLPLKPFKDLSWKERRGDKILFRPITGEGYYFTPSGLCLSGNPNGIVNTTRLLPINTPLSTNVLVLPDTFYLVRKVSVYLKAEA